MQQLNSFPLQNDSQIKCQNTFEQLNSDMIKQFKPLGQIQDNLELFETSMAMQQKYQCSETLEKENIFHTLILPRVNEFIQDKYNHYVIQCVLIMGPQSHKNLITANVFQNIGIYWNKKYAYKVIQWVLSEEDCPEKPLIIEYILQNLKRFAVDQYGNLIVSHLVQFLTDEKVFAYFLRELQVMTLVQHQQGCLVVIKLVEFSRHKNPAIQNQIVEMFDKMIDVSLPLCYEQYSNYVIQRILIQGDIENKKKLLNNVILPNFFKLAKNKFGSNVCEKALENALSYQLQNLWVQCLDYHFKSLVNDDFANYVMQAYYFQIRLFRNIQNEYMSKLIKLNEQLKLNHNGRIVYKYVMQCNQVVPTELYCMQQQYFSGN